MAHTDCTEGTEEEPNSALLLEYGAHGLHAEDTNEKPNSALLLESLKQQIQQVQRIQPMGQNLLEV